MKRAQQQRQGRGGFDLVEQATHLLRAAPAATLAVYYLGAIPFVLGLLYFWADMSRSPFAYQHLTGSALGLAALFFWMKFWQVIFARHIRAQITREPPPRWTIRRCGRILLTQILVQPTGLFLIPLSLLPVLPFAWVYSFYQNATVLADGEFPGTAKLVTRSGKQALLWPGQNHLTLAIMLGFGFYVFLNWTVVCFMLPQLIKMLLGIGSVFTKSPTSILNTTFFTGMLALTYLCVDPILKVIYSLRCFYGESLQSGEDLKAELKPFVTASRQTAMALLMALAFFCVSPATAARPAPPAPSPAPTPGVSTSELDRAINQTIHKSKYTWRMPREKIVEPDSDEGIFARFFDRVGELLRRWTQAVLDWWSQLLNKLFHPKPATFTPAASGYGWIMSLEIMLYGLLAVVVAALAVFLYRIWRDRRRPPTPVPSEAFRHTPDLADENLGADQLPEDGWLNLARNLLAQGELRLALRAFYLASLSHLAARNLISLARFKSNLEYERELRRRGHAFPDLLSVFDDNLLVFEAIWYGMHEANPELVTRFAANVERMKASG